MSERTQSTDLIIQIALEFKYLKKIVCLCRAKGLDTTASKDLAANATAVGVQVMKAL
jgi:hypothetical protein